jgi:hypothetical protein
MIPHILFTAPPKEKVQWIVCFGIPFLIHALYQVLHPYAFVYADTAQFFPTVMHFFETGTILIDPMILPGYGLFLIPQLALVWDTLLITCTQHVLILCTGLIYASLGFKLAGNTPWVGMGILFIIGMEPTLFGYGQVLLPEVLLFFLIGVIFWLLYQSHDRKAIPWWSDLLVGLILGFMIITKPISWVLLPSIGIILLGTSASTWYQKIIRIGIRGGLILVPLMLFNVGYSNMNYQQNGYYGIKPFGGILWFGATARMIDLDSALQQEVKEKIRPYLEEYRTRSIWTSQTPHIVCHSTGPMPIIYDHFNRDLPKTNQACREMAIEAIMHKPGEYIRYVVMQWFCLFFGRYDTHAVFLQPEKEVKRYACTICENKNIPDPKNIWIDKPYMPRSLFHPERSILTQSNGMVDLIQHIVEVSLVYSPFRFIALFSIPFFVFIIVYLVRSRRYLVWGTRLAYLIGLWIFPLFYLGAIGALNRCTSRYAVLVEGIFIVFSILSIHMFTQSSPISNPGRSHNIKRP